MFSKNSPLILPGKKEHVKKVIYPNKESLHILQKGIIKKMFLSCFVMVFIGGLNSLWTKLDYNAWHDTLIRPFFAPEPDWIVAIFWGIAYTLLGITYAYLWQIKETNQEVFVQKIIRKAFNLFYLQMFVNLIVPTFFFGLKNLYLVQIGVVTNLSIVIWMIYFYSQFTKRLGYLLFPYAVWLLYATILDATILFLNDF